MTTETFAMAEWAVVLPKRHGSIFASPYLEPMTIEARETGHALGECFGCGQFREDVRCVEVDVTMRSGERDTTVVEVCRDCRVEAGQ